MKLELLVLLFSIEFSLTLDQYGNCDYFQRLSTTSQFTITSPGYPGNYLSGTQCRWAAEAPPGFKVSLNCVEFQLPSSFLCNGDSLSVSQTGRVDLGDGERFCGSRSPFQIESTSYRMTIALNVGRLSKGGKFRCTIRAVKNNCNCGVRNRGKISKVKLCEVGGSQTLPNEYPSMAGLVDFIERRIFCGATIISTTHALSAAHCKLGRKISDMGVVVGEHNTTTGQDSPYTKLIRVSEFVNHPQFNSDTNANDIALVKTITAMTFTKGVQPACLPFRYTTQSLIGRVVQAVGWGSIEFAGPQSDALKQVSLTIVERGSCTTKQICSFGGIGEDTCQSDSGGPLYLNDNNILYAVGIVSYGLGCGTDEPAVNTRVASYLDWIIERTPKTTYCVL